MDENNEYVYNKFLGLTDEEFVQLIVWKGI